MSLPRCSVIDMIGYGADAHTENFALRRIHWRKKNLTYRISKYPKLLQRQEVDNEISRAFSVWSDHTDLSFRQKYIGAADIDIRFEVNGHSDEEAFDGPGGVLAHAYFPMYGGNAHFDDAEQWTIGVENGINLFQVAAHEFGHSLGLGHSRVHSALMEPFYRGYNPNFQLSKDDILGIQSLYGPKTKIGQSTNPISPKEEHPNLCNSPSIDSIFHTSDNKTFIFKGDKYYRIVANDIAPGYPKNISEGWPGLPGKIDAAFTHQNGKTYFFQGTKYWRYRGKEMDADYPKEISDGFPGIPNHLDAVMVWGYNAGIYFFKGSQFWRYNSKKKPPVPAVYPKEISYWNGIPNGINAVVHQGKKFTYFFKDDKYYRFNNEKLQVDQDDPPFPRQTAAWWFGCKNETDIITTTEKSGMETFDELDDFLNDNFWTFDADSLEEISWIFDNE
ncbi:matrix metalloproteinase-14-like [Anopheles nili]|uniref:matrix metalloproteinase-14-like n=1 Tax=Anopheles nili TaxID=185578 RepID=UPI00237A5178|nr:matrix metalloproteinase-14-like [Anopheles nili]